MAQKYSSQTNTKNLLVPIIQAILRSGKIVYIILLAALAFFAYQYFFISTSSVANETQLIQQQIKNVGKLVVTEGSFAEVITYKDQKKVFGDFFSFEKKAIVIVNTDVTVAFNLHEISYDIDQENKTVTIKNIPEEEIKIYPKIKFYDIEQSSFNEFTGEDYNKINKIVKENVTKKIEKSSLKTNAKNRLIAELAKMLILTNSMGWTLQYKGNTITSEKQLENNLIP